MAKSTGKAPSSAKAKAARSVVAKRSAQGAQFMHFAIGSIPGAGFLAKTKLKKAGGSLVATIPAAARNLLHLTEGQELAVSVEGSKVVMEPMPSARPMRVRRPKYTLDELVAGTSPAPLRDEERDWHDAPPVGRETW